MNPVCPAIASLAALLVSATAFGQQPPPSPYGNAPPPVTLRVPPVAQPGSGTTSDAGVAATLTRTPVYPPPMYYPPNYGPYGIPYIESPAHGYLSGAAEVTTAQGNYLNQTQTARILQTQADSAKLDLRVRMAEQQRYLKSLEPTPEELRQKEIVDAINRSRNNPPVTEIWSGKALNDLVIGIRREQRGGQSGPSVALDPGVLAHINLRTETTPAGIGMLKDLRRFQWPLPLLDDSFGDKRAQIESLARQAAEEAASAPINPKLLRDLQKAINDMIGTVKSKVDDMTPGQYTQSMRYLRELADSSKVLQDPNVANYFTDKYRATGNTVAELLAGMTSRGLIFAPAASGDEPYYTVLHGALVTYDYGLRQLAAR